MAEIVNVRIDYRMIHGVINTLWVPTLGCDKIVLVDDKVAKDQFMLDVFRASIMPSIKFKAFTFDEFIERYTQTKFGSGKVFVIFKDYKKCLEAHEKGFVFDSITLGTVMPTDDRTLLIHHVSLNKEEYNELLTFSHEKNVKVLLQFTPQVPPVTLEAAGSGKYK